MKKKSFAIIGDPIVHSLSPVLHNYWFNKYNIEADYSLLNISEKAISKNKKITSNTGLSQRPPVANSLTKFISA